MPLALFPELTLMLRRLGKALAPWVRMVRIEELLIRRAQSAYLTHWFGRNVPEKRLSLHIAIRNVAALRDRYQLAGRSRPDPIPEINLLGPLSGIAGLLVGMALSPTGLDLIASQLRRIVGLASDMSPFKKFLTGLAGFLLLTVPGLPPALALVVGLPLMLIAGFLMVVGGNGEARAAVTLLGELALLIDALGRFWDQLSGPRDQVRNPLLKRILETFDRFAGLFVQLLGLIGFLLVRVSPQIPNLMDQFRAVMTLVGLAMSALGKILSGVLHALLDPFTKDDGLLEMLKGVLDPLMTIPGRVIEGIEQAIVTATAALKLASDTIFEQVGDFAKAFVARLGDAFKTTAVGKFLERMKAVLALLPAFSIAFSTAKPPAPADKDDEPIQKTLRAWYVDGPSGGASASAAAVLDAIEKIQIPSLPDLTLPTTPTAPTLPDLDALLIANPRPEIPDIGKLANELIDEAWAAQAKAPVPRAFDRKPVSAFADERKRLEATVPLPSLALNNLALRDLIYLAVGRVLPPALRTYAPSIRAFFDWLDETLYQAPKMDKAGQEAAEKLLPVQDLGDSGLLFPKIGKLRFVAKDGEATDLRAFRDIVLGMFERQSYVAQAAR